MSSPLPDFLQDNVGQIIAITVVILIIIVIFIAPGGEPQPCITNAYNGLIC